MTARRRPRPWRCTGATKRFGAVVALDDVDLAVHRGEVLALLGDNGAGKSTLIKCVSGVHRLDAGAIEMDGEPVEIPSPAAARALGIETVYQDLAALRQPRPGGQLLRRPGAGRAALAAPRAAAACAAAPWPTATVDVLGRLQVGLPDARTAVGLMSGGQRQAIAVARAAAFASRVVILDEPTAALGAARVAAGARPHPAAPGRGPRGHRHLPRHGPRHGDRRPGRGHAPRPQGRRGGPAGEATSSGSSR